MEILKAYTAEDLARITRKRVGEEKVGEVMEAVALDWKKDLTASEAKFVLIGIPEDIGVRANYGRAGASTAFKPALDNFLNQQNNFFLHAHRIFLLGEIFVDDLMEQAKQYEGKEQDAILHLRELVTELDKRVTEVIKFIVSIKKIPLIVGGGHNNAFGNIKGASLATGKKINVINCDPHLDFRPREGRHSGNGFSYAYEDGLLQKYSVFAAHEQYNNKYSLEHFLHDPGRLHYNSYESVFIREETNVRTALEQSISFVKDNSCGIELDLDAIINVPSSAKTSSGITAMHARQYVYKCGLELDCLYLHIAEGAPVLSHIKADNKTGKLISYLLSDFIKAFVLRESVAEAGFGQ